MTKISKSGEYIYYVVTGPNTVKFGGSSNINKRQKAHYTSSPFLIMHTYRVNDAYSAEREIHKIVAKYKLKCANMIDMDMGTNTDTIVTFDAQSYEHYILTEKDARKVCEIVQKKFDENKKLGKNRTYCVGCHRVMNINTLSKNDGFRCKRCFEKEMKNFIH